jgi:hypothetical protein
MKTKAAKKVVPMPSIGDVYQCKDERGGIRRVRVVKLARSIKKAICENTETERSTTIAWSALATAWRRV